MPMPDAAITVAAANNGLEIYRYRQNYIHSGSAAITYDPAAFKGFFAGEVARIRREIGSAPTTTWSQVMYANATALSEQVRQTYRDHPVTVAGAAATALTAAFVMS